LDREGGKDKAMVKAVLMAVVAPGHAMGQGVATLLEQLDRHYLAPDGSLATKSAYLDLVQVLTSFHPSCQFLCFCFKEESDRGAEYFFLLTPSSLVFLFLFFLWALKVLWVFLFFGVKAREEMARERLRYLEGVVCFPTLTFLLLFFSIPLWEVRFGV
jgi:hypothetical protein